MKQSSHGLARRAAACASPSSSFPPGRCAAWFCKLLLPRDKGSPDCQKGSTFRLCTLAQIERLEGPTSDKDVNTFRCAAAHTVRGALRTPRTVCSGTEESWTFLSDVGPCCFGPPLCLGANNQNV